MCQTLLNTSDNSGELDGPICYTKLGHVVGMLDRDQRTAKYTKRATTKQAPYDEITCHNNKVKQYNSESGGEISHVFPRTLPKLSGNRWKSYYGWKSLQRLRQLLVVGAYLLSIVSIPESISAPIDSMNSEQTTEFWRNPCKYPVEDLENRQNTPVEVVSSAVGDLKKICQQARIDFTYADAFKDEYVEKLQIEVRSYQKHSYPWFPNNEEDLHIDMEGQIAEDHLASLTIEDFVIRIYNYLQKFGAGIEIIINDQQSKNGEFLSRFQETRNYLKILLCEIQEFMFNHNIQQMPDVSRDEVPKDIHMSDTTGTTIRDWIIFRDYLTTLRYIISAAEYLEKKS